MSNSDSSNRLSEFLQSWWLVAIIVALCSVIAYQRWQMTHRRALPVLRAGESLPALAATDIRGNKATISWKHGDRATLIYIFRPGCQWCGRNMESMQAFERLVENRYRFIGISTTPTDLSQYVAKNSLAFPVYVIAPSSAAGSKLKLRGTPETLLVDDGGRVTNVWLGAYAGATHDRIQDALHITFPALIMAPMKGPAVSPVQ